MQVRSLLSLVTAGVAVAGGFAVWQQGYLVPWQQWLTHWVTGADYRYTSAQFRADVLGRINQARSAGKLPGLGIDPLIEAALDREFPDVVTADVSRVNAMLEQALPRYYGLSVCVANAPTLTALLGEIDDFATRTQPEMTHFGCAIRSSVAGLGQNALLVVGHQLADFSPEVLSQSDADAFYNECPHCQHPHTVGIPREQHSLGLECPRCRRTYAVVAADENGQFRYVNEFLTGYAPPAVFGREQSRLHELFTIWTAVTANCVYSKDPGARRNQTDNWQTSLETQRLGRGDCEDSSIFLCDWLLARGFQARVALGRYGDMGGHAWCIVKLDGKEYLLESTEGRPDPANPPLAARIGSRYIPEVLFDRFAIYVRSAPSQNWSGDYWSTKIWTRIEPRQLRPGAGRVATGSRPGVLDPSRVARVTASNPAAAPFTELEEIPANADVWQVPLPMTRPDAK